ncbi:MAG: pilin [Patescibacteria group bacterium]
MDIYKHILGSARLAAVQVEQGLETAAKEAGVGRQENLPVLIGNILEYILGFVGVALLVVVIYGGFLWMTAGGEEEQVRRGRNYIFNGIIGLAIILSSYAILSYVMTRVLIPLQ